MGAFTGMAVRNTDGIAVFQRRAGSTVAGALYAIHDDRAIAAFEWSDAAKSMGLRADCVR